MKIGILGSSFNPAHLGHLKLSDKAIQIFDLDEVWWMITKQNPLKEKNDYMSFEDRSNQAKKLIGNNNIKLKFFEDITCLLYTSPSPRDVSTSRMPSSA